MFGRSIQASTESGSIEMSPRQLTNGIIQVTVATPAQLNFCQSQCQQPFTAAAQAVTGRLIAVSFHCNNLPRGGVFNEGDQPLPLNPDYVFENFVTGPCNRLPHAASLAVAEQPGRHTTRCLSTAASGSARLICCRRFHRNCSSTRADARILYLSCDSFINQFILAIENGDMHQFRHRYRHVDLLVIDDIHFLAGRDRTQEEFFHTFNTLYQQHKQIILSADCPPSEIPELEERLVSRFNWGLVARIEKPCYETRVAILQKKARMRGLTLPEDVVCYIAAKVENNTRELEGAITKLQGLGMLQNGRIDLELAKSRAGRCGHAGAETDHHPADPGCRHKVLQCAAQRPSGQTPPQEHHISPAGLHVSRPAAHSLFLEEIGGYFGGRDHTTVLHAVRTVDADAKTEREVADQLTQLEAQLNSV